MGRAKRLRRVGQRVAGTYTFFFCRLEGAQPRVADEADAVEVDRHDMVDGSKVHGGVWGGIIGESCEVAEADGNRPAAAVEQDACTKGIHSHDTASEPIEGDCREPLQPDHGAKEDRLVGEFRERGL